LDKSRQVPVALWLCSNRHDRLSDVMDSLEWDDLLDRRDRLSRLHVFETEQCWNVSRAKLSNDFSLWAHVDGHLLDASLGARVDHVDRLTVSHRAGEQASSGNDASLGVHHDIDDRHWHRALVVALDHGLAEIAVGLSMPYLGNPVNLGNVGRRHDVNRHTQHGFVYWSVRLQILNFVVEIRVDNISELDPLFPRNFKVEAPAVFRGSHCYRVGCEVDLPL